MRKIKIESKGTGESTRVIDATTGEKIVFSKELVVRFDPKTHRIKAMLTRFDMEPEVEGKQRCVKSRPVVEGDEFNRELIVVEEECVVVSIDMPENDDDGSMMIGPFLREPGI